MRSADGADQIGASEFSPRINKCAEDAPPITASQDETVDTQVRAKHRTLSRKSAVFLDANLDPAHMRHCVDCFEGLVGRKQRVHAASVGQFGVTFVR